MKWDKEYSTMYWKEVEYLKNNGVYYCFVKTSENGCSVFKYKKTKRLFELLSNFYSD